MASSEKRLKKARTVSSSGSRLPSSSILSSLPTAVPLINYINSPDKWKSSLDKKYKLGDIIDDFEKKFKERQAKLNDERMTPNVLDHYVSYHGIKEWL